MKEGFIKSKKNTRIDKDMQKVISKKINRRLCLKNKKHSILRAFSLFGLVGWSIGVPTIIFAYLGLFLDEKFPVSFSYTLYFVLLGLGLGCYNAWKWLKKEQSVLDKEDICNE